MRFPGTSEGYPFGGEHRQGRSRREGNGSLAGLSKAELEKRARKAGIDGRSTMTKDELVEALETV